MTPVPKINQAELKKHLHYNPRTGIFTWVKSNSPKAKNGSVAGYVSHAGYREIRINKRNYLAHRLAWLYIHGYFPEHEIDHINRQRDDNKISNLRHVSRSCNVKNCAISKDNKSGVTGVHWDRCARKWKASIQCDKKRKTIGYFISKDDAVMARWKEEVKLNFPSCNSTSSSFRFLSKRGLV